MVEREIITEEVDQFDIGEKFDFKMPDRNDAQTASMKVISRPLAIPGNNLVIDIENLDNDYQTEANRKNSNELS